MPSIAWHLEQHKLKRALTVEIIEAAYHAFQGNRPKDLDVSRDYARSVADALDRLQNQLADIGKVSTAREIVEDPDTTTDDLECAFDLSISPPHGGPGEGGLDGLEDDEERELVRAHRQSKYKNTLDEYKEELIEAIKEEL